MGLQRDNGWGSSEAVFEPLQVEHVLSQLGIVVRGQTEHDFLAECPFHFNVGSPAFTISKTTGLFFCHNPACSKSGNLFQLTGAVRNKGELDAKKFIYSHNVPVDYVSVLRKTGESKEIKPFSQDKIDELVAAFPDSPAEEYMFGRGFESGTLQHFQIGYSAKRKAVTVPMHNEHGTPVGLVSRSIEGKNFGSSLGLPKSSSAWNMHRAKRFGEVLIVVESSFDAMRVHQAGYPNVVAMLGGYLSTEIKEQLEVYSTSIIIMTDNDPLQFRPNCRKCGYKCVGHNPGRELANNIEEQVRRQVLWAAQGPEIYPHGAKDACDLSEQEISHLLSNAVSGVQYHMWVG